MIPRKFAEISSLYLFTSMTSFAGFNKEKRESPKSPRESSTRSSNRYNRSREDREKRWTVLRLSANWLFVTGTGRDIRDEQWIRVWSRRNLGEPWLRTTAPSQRVYILTSCIQIMWFVGDSGPFESFRVRWTRRGANHRGELRRRRSSPTDRVSPFDRVKSNIEVGTRNEKVFRSRPRVHADLISPWIRFHEILAPVLTCAVKFLRFIRVWQRRDTIRNVLITKVIINSLILPLRN